MSVVLVVEQDASYREQIVQALSSEGWTVRTSDHPDDAQVQARSQPPQLVIASAALPNVRHFLAPFAAGGGGPGAIVLVPATLVGRVSPADYHADQVISKPFDPEELRQAARRLLPAEPASAAAADDSDQDQLTSADIFGDVLAEVEAEATRGRGAGRPPVEARPLGASVRDPQLSTASRRRPRPRFDDIDRKLEETLSGVMPIGGTLKRPGEAVPDKPAAAKPRSEPSEIDRLLNQTLSSIELPRIRRGRPRAEPPQEAPRRAPEAPVATEPSTPAEAPVEEPAFEPPPVLATDLPTTTKDEPPSFEPPPDLGPPPPVAKPSVAKPSVAKPPSHSEPPSFEAPPPSFAEAPSFAAAPSFAEVPSPFAGRVAPPDLAPAAPDDAFRTQMLPIMPRQAPEVAKPAPAEEPAPAAGPSFGDYALLERIAVGGMAEVWKARRRGVEGFQKTVAIKKILAHLTGSPDFVTMFIDEAKLAAQLNHANIIQIYDLGKVGDDFFIAMEYVDGVDLRTILQTARRDHQPMPNGLAALVAMSIARALDYAHRKRDFDNQDLGLVHRDVSPQNVMISYEGEIKLCDFGIVKAVVKASTTQMGALKGKLQYMSPEQAWGKPVDSRSDIFSLGSVLFESLTGQKLFTGDSEIGVLDAVRECRIRPPREIVPGLPEEIDRITRKALAKTPEARYQTAGEMEQDLKSFLVGLKPMPTQSDLAVFMHRLFTDAPEPKAALAPEPKPAARSREAASPAPETKQARPAPEPSARAAAPTPAATAARAAGAGKRPPGRQRFLAIAAVVAAIVLGAVLLFLLRGGDDAPAPTRAPAEVAPAGPATPAEDLGAKAATAESDAGAAPTTGGPGEVAATDTAAGGATAAGEPVGEPGDETGQSTSVGSVDLEDMVEKAFSKQAEELNQDFEAQRKQLEKELEEARKAAAASDSKKGGGSR